ncbi:MAG: hypothetical protein QNJ47_02400 [Nostocaceae cyanobacterium]|nr:hypothetical protein [Nostocaceae cyanobacterium]
MKNILNGRETQARTRLLLALWDLGGINQEVKKGKLAKRIVSKGTKIADYQSIFEELTEKGAIAMSKNGYTLSPQGLEILSQGLQNPEFRFPGTIIGTWVVNALLEWISQMDEGINSVSPSVNGNRVKSGIKSYSEFEKVASQVYEKLNREYNFNHLVPIYRIRREIGNRVTRADFNEWLLEMQANDILQLQGGTVEDSALDKIEDSISTELDGLRCYARILQP